jgi:hypothetical protein
MATIATVDAATITPVSFSVDLLAETLLPPPLLATSDAFRAASLVDHSENVR